MAVMTRYDDAKRSRYATVEYKSTTVDSNPIAICSSMPARSYLALDENPQQWQESDDRGGTGASRSS
jgi:hypothetical protein